MARWVTVASFAPSRGRRRVGSTHVDSHGRYWICCCLKLATIARDALVVAATTKHKLTILVSLARSIEVTFSLIERARWRLLLGHERLLIIKTNCGLKPCRGLEPYTEGLL